MKQETDLTVALACVNKAVNDLLHSPRLRIRDANPSEQSGDYMFEIDGAIAYVGEAKGSGGLRDRILRKHVAGDEGHALQRHFRDPFPDRGLRREHIKDHVRVAWCEVEQSLVPLVERAAIWLIDPPLNRN